MEIQIAVWEFLKILLENLNKNLILKQKKRILEISVSMG